MKLNWEFKNFTRIEDVVALLSSEDIENIVIIGHGKKSGQLVDSTRATYPIGSFSMISPNLRSLAFFSCYGKKTIEYYSLNNLLKDSNSNFSKRYLVTVKERDQELSGQVAPLNGAKSFLKKWDKFLSNLPRKVISNVQMNKSCLVKIKNIELESGALSVSLNRQLVTLIRPGKNDYEGHFPCSFLKSDRNILVVKNESTHSNATGHFDRVYFEINGVDLTNSAQTFINPDNSLRSYLLRF